MDLIEIIKEFEKKKIVVIGDIMLDKYVSGKVVRISPEAPVPVIIVESEIYELGGAGNVSNNVLSLGGEAILFGFIGDDSEGEIVKKLLEENKVKNYLGHNHRTTVKERIIGGHQQIVRCDREDAREKIFGEKFKKILEREIEDSDIVLISDYAKGAISSDLFGFLSGFDKRIIVDPKPQNKNLYENVYLLTPNMGEALEMTGLENIDDAGKILKMRAENILITKSEKGMTLFTDKVLDIPTYAREVYDVMGAGDSVIATLALALASNASLEEAAILANHAAGIVVGKAGTYHVKLRELESKILGEKRKVKSLEELQTTVQDLKRKGMKTVWTNGCFDILHEGHIKYLRKAKEHGDCLIVGINSDSSIRKIKGHNRPIRPENARAEILSGLEFVDYVTIFSDMDSTRYLSVLKPEIYAKGGDYDINSINQDERGLVENYGGKITIIPTEENISTSRIIEEIKNSH